MRLRQPAEQQRETQTGRYVPHAEMFGKYHQADLAALYEKNPPPELGFAFGYHWQKDRGILMLGTKN